MSCCGSGDFTSYTSAYYLMHYSSYNSLMHIFCAYLNSTLYLGSRFLKSERRVCHPALILRQLIRPSRLPLPILDCIPSLLVDASSGL
jgi:hypothetical protein